MKNINCELIIAGRPFTISELLEIAKQVISSDKATDFEKSLYAFILEWLSDQSFIKVKTSGSTGASKWMKVEKEKMIKSAQLTGAFLNLRKNDTSLLCIPVDFIAGKMMVVRAFVLGLNLIPVEPSGNPLKEINHSLDFAAMTPMQVYNTFKQPNGRQNLNRIKNLIIGGGEINESLLSSIKHLTNKTYHTYGMTETLTHVALKKINGKDADPYFKALEGIWFEKDSRGCLVIHASHIANAGIVTNDIVDLKDDRSFQFIGRFDNIINSGGVKIVPERIERRLFQYIPKPFFVAGLPDKKLGQKLVLIVEGSSGQDIDLNQIFDKALKSKYEKPRKIYYLKQFSRTENGKIKRKEAVKQILQSTNYN